MLTLKMQIILFVMILVFIIYLFVLARKRSLDAKYVLAWMLISLGVLVFTLIPPLMDMLSEAIGVFSPVNMVFFIGFIYMGLIVFALSIAISRQSQRMKKLIQKIALLEKEIDEIQKDE